MLLLALQWGGETYAWNSPQIAGLLTGGVLELLVFAMWQLYLGDLALIPPKVLGQRTVAASFGMSFFLSGTILAHAYYLPYWFQAVRFQSPVQSGVNMLPYVATMFAMSIVAGSLVTKTGWFTPPALVGPVIGTIGCGLLTTLDADTPTARWVGFMILTGGGMGIGFQQGIIATQAVLPPHLVAIGSNMIMFAQSLAGAIFVSVGNSVLRNELVTALHDEGFAEDLIARLINAGATNVHRLVDPAQLGGLITAYNWALSRVFVMAVPLAGLGFVSVWPMEWKNIKAKDTAGAAKMEVLEERKPDVEDKAA